MYFRGQMSMLEEMLMLSEIKCTQGKTMDVKTTEQNNDARDAQVPWLEIIFQFFIIPFYKEN